MTKRTRMVWFVLFAVLAVMAAWLVYDLPEPSYRGHSLTSWLQIAYRNDDFRIVVAYDADSDLPSANAIRAMGARVLPTVIRMVQARDSTLRRRWLELVQNLSWLPIHVRPIKEIHEKAAYAFRVLGLAAQPALPKLTTLLEDPDPEVRLVAAYCIGCIGPGSTNAIGPLQRVLTNLTGDSRPIQWGVEQRYLTAFALGEIGPEARSALPQLRVLCADSNELVYASAQAAVIKITGSGIDALIAALGDTFDSAKWNQACAAVGFLGNAGSNAIPVLLATTAHGDPVAVEKAIEALGKIHSRPEICIPGILPLLQNTNEWVRLHSLSSISAFGTNARRFVATSELVRCLGDPSRLVHETATNALRYLAPEAAVKAGISMDP